MRSTLRLPVVALMLGVDGCTLLTATPPSVEVMDVRLVGIAPMEQQLAVTLCVTNPNGSELAFRHVTAGLDVSGSPLAAGASDLSVRLPPVSSTAVPFTVVTTIQNLGPQLLGIFRTGSVDYRVHGTVTLQGVLGIELPYLRAGRVDPVAGALRLAFVASDPKPSRCVQSASPAPTRL